VIDHVVRNAVITSAEILRDASTSKVEVRLDYGSAGSQSAGVHELTPELANRLMAVARVDRWSQLPGQVVRVRAHPQRGVAALGHVLEDEWLELSQEASGDVSPAPGGGPSDEDIPF
jgi:hypothetical protein